MRSIDIVPRKENSRGQEDDEAEGDQDGRPEEAHQGGRGEAHHEGGEEGADVSGEVGGRDARRLRDRGGNERDGAPPRLVAVALRVALKAAVPVAHESRKVTLRPECGAS